MIQGKKIMAVGGGFATIPRDPRDIFDDQLHTWLDSDPATQIISSGLETWEDKSGNARHYTQPTLANRGGQTANIIADSRPYIEFMGNQTTSNDWIQGPQGLPTTFTVFALVQARRSTLTANIADPVFGTGRSGTSPIPGWLVHSYNGYQTYRSARLLQQEGTYKGRIWKNGIEVTDFETSKLYPHNLRDWFIVTAQTTGHPTDRSMAVSAMVNPDATTQVGWHVIAEIGIIANADEDTRLKAEGYLARKYGLQNLLPDTHIYKQMGVPRDPHWQNLSLFLTGMGVESSTAQTDVSPRPKTLTATAPIDGFRWTSSGASITFNTQYVRVTPVNNEFIMDGDFTVELWSRTTQATPNAASRLIHANGGASMANFGNLLRCYVNDTDASPLMISTRLINDNPARGWKHYVWCRQGSTNYMYIDGVLETTAINSSTINFGTNGGVLSIGQRYNNGSSTAVNSYVGSLDDIRVTKGVCRYPNGTTFSPPYSSPIG